jgi:hypothetical protein
MPTQSPRRNVRHELMRGSPLFRGQVASLVSSSGVVEGESVPCRAGPNGSSLDPLASVLSGLYNAAWAAAVPGQAATDYAAPELGTHYQDADFWIGQALSSTSRTFSRCGGCAGMSVSKWTGNTAPPSVNVMSADGDGHFVVPRQVSPQG